MGEKIYYQDQYIKKFSAKVVSVKKEDNINLVELDKTAFYPEGGGQPADKGYLDDIEVTDVLKKNNKIWHKLKTNALAKGEDVKGEIDWKRRFNHMQQHTGQHILSAVLYNNYNIRTVGFHISQNYLSIDIDKKVSNNIIYDAEAKSNDIIYNNININSFFICKNDLNNYCLRKKPEVENNIRLVKIGDLDTTPCGGTHLANTGELGIIKVINIDSYKEGLRIKFVCGRWAVNDFHYKNKIVAECRNILSTANNNIINRISELQKDLDEKDKIINTLKEEINNYRCSKLLQDAEKINDVKIIKNIFSNESYNNIRMLTKDLISKENIVVIFAIKDKNKVQIISGRSSNLEFLNMNNIIKIPLAIINGKGGGNKLMAQGGSDNCSKIEEAVNTTYREIKKLLK